MEKCRKPDLFPPSIENAENATQVLLSFYRRPNDNFSTGQLLTNREAEQRLFELRDHIMDGVVHTHFQIAEVLWSLGSLISPIKRSASAEIDFAAYGVHIAALQKQGSFHE
ncbi:MAG: hypothetical protein AAB662_03745 [Patescibacteria group bacterium]